VRDRVAGRRDGELERRAVVGRERTPAAVGTDDLAVQRRAAALAGACVGAVDLDGRADERQVVGVGAFAGLTLPSSTMVDSDAAAVVCGGSPVMKRYAAAKAFGPYEVSRWSMPAMTTFSAPFSSGPAAVTFVGVPFAPIQTPSGCANLSLASERIVIHFGPGVISMPGPPWLFSAVRNGPAPLNSLIGMNAGLAQTPWLGVPPRIACETFFAPPPWAM
jgi:hypothetical protein